MGLLGNVAGCMGFKKVLGPAQLSAPTDRCTVPDRHDSLAMDGPNAHLQVERVVIASHRSPFLPAVSTGTASEKVPTI